MPDAKPVREAYADWAQRYDRDPNKTRDLDAMLLRAADLPLDGARVVELGAGTGKNTVYLAAHAAHVMALDLSEAMLSVARRRVLDPHVTFTVHDVTRPWPVADRMADLVVGNLVLEHVAEIGPVFHEARRVLRTGGIFYLSELHPYRQWRGAGAHYPGPAGDIRVEAYVHTMADYIGAALRAGLALAGLSEAGDDNPPADGRALPRLLQITFTAPPR